MRSFILILVCCFPLFLFCQTKANDSIPLQDTSIKNKSYITFGVSPLQFLITPRWKFGYIHTVNENIKLGATFGIGGNNFVFTSYETKFKEYFLWEIRPEIYFIHNPGKRVSLYNSVELFYIYEDDVIVNSRFITENDNTIYYDQADYNRQKFGGVINFGVFIPFTSHFGINVNAGMGIKWRNNEYSNIINPEFQTGYSDFFWRSYFKKEGMKIGFEPNFGVKLLYII